MKRIAIIDDEADARESLRNLLDLCPGVAFCGEAEGVASGFELIKNARPDAVLLDISIDGGTGFDLLDRFPMPPCRVIFITAHDEFALRAFRYHALDYLLKPILPRDLLLALERISVPQPTGDFARKVSSMLGDVRQHQLEKIALHTQEGLVFLRLDSIVRLQSEGSYTTFFTASKERYTVSKNIKDYEEMLPAEQFCRVHQSHIVHFSFVKKYLRADGGCLEMEDGYQVPIAQRRRAEILKWLPT